MLPPEPSTSARSRFRSSRHSAAGATGGPRKTRRTTRRYCLRSVSRQRSGSRATAWLRSSILSTRRRSRCSATWSPTSGARAMRTSPGDRRKCARAVLMYPKPHPSLRLRDRHRRRGPGRLGRSDQRASFVATTFENNATLTIVGDLEPVQDQRELVQRRFGPIPRGGRYTARGRAAAAEAALFAGTFFQTHWRRSRGSNPMEGREAVLETTRPQGMYSQAAFWPGAGLAPLPRLGRTRPHARAVFRGLEPFAPAWRHLPGRRFRQLQALGGRVGSRRERRDRGGADSGGDCRRGRARSTIDHRRHAAEGSNGSARTAARRTCSATTRCCSGIRAYLPKDLARYRAVTPEKVQAFARKYLLREERAVLNVEPAPKAQATRQTASLR